MPATLGKATGTMSESKDDDFEAMSTQFEVLHTVLGIDVVGQEARRRL